MVCITGTLNALTKLRVGDLMAQDEGKELLRLIVAENVLVANRKGIEIDLEGTVRFILAANAEASDHITSMLKDVLSHRKTEIGSLNEAVAREAEKLGLSAPVNKTVALLTKIIEKTYDRQVTA